MGSAQTQALNAAITGANLSPLLMAAVIDATVAPTFGSTGYDVPTTCAGAIARCILRQNPVSRRVIVSLTTFDSTCIYTATIDGTAVAVTNPATAVALWNSWATNINASAANTVVTATAYDSTGASGDPDSLLIDTIGEAGVPVIITQSSAAALDVLYEYESARLRLYSRARPAEVAQMATAAERLAATAWELMDASTGQADYAITGEGGRFALSPGGEAAVRPYLTDLELLTGETLGTSSGVTTTASARVWVAMSQVPA